MQNDAENGEPLVQILERHEDYAFGRLFRIVRAVLSFRRFDGRMAAPQTRISFERGDSVGVLLHDPDADVVVLVNQFRYPVYESLESEDDPRRAWILETVAGVKGEDDAPAVANREMLEEAGYRVDGPLEPMGVFYVSPGGTSERIHLFLGRVDHLEPDERGGGLEDEGEDIQVVALPFARAMEMIESGEIRDAKTIIALQQLALMRR